MGTLSFFAGVVGALLLFTAVVGIFAYAQAQKSNVGAIKLAGMFAALRTRRAAYVVVWLLFLLVLWMFREEVPLWDLWRANEKFFWVSQVVILAILLTSDIGPWPRLIGILLGVLALALVVMAVYWGANAILSAITSPAPAKTVTASKTVTVKRVVAYPAEWTKKETIPPLHLFSLDFGGEIKIQGLNGKPFNAKPGEPVWLGIDESNFAFSFMSLEKSPVEITISTWPR